MFAFAVYDKKRKTLFVARDRFGIKPFYYTFDGKSFIFASELRPILDVRPELRVADSQAVYDYLVFSRLCHNENTFFKDIKKLQHGCVLKLKDKKVQIRKWYDLQSALKPPFKSPEELFHSFSEATSLRLRSDVPVGACLSGGLDSSAIVSVVHDCLEKKDLTTFSCVSEEGDRTDETPFIREYEGKIKDMFYSRLSAGTLLADIDRFISTHPEPVPGTSAYAEYKLMRLAKKHVTVALMGQGADEEMAGYHYFFGMMFKELFYKFRWNFLIKEVVSYTRKHHSMLGFYSMIYFMLPPFMKDFASLNSIKYVNKDFALANRGSDTILRELYGADSLNSSLLKHFEYKLEHLLTWGDRNSMAFSLELRFPFLDHNFVEKVLSLPREELIHDGETKHIFRRAMKGVLPEKIRTRQDKIGFETPEDKWFRLPAFREKINDVLSDRAFDNMGFVDAETARGLYHKHLAGRKNISKDIWKWINLYNWHKKYIENGNA
jgi:asparagine synthase (glutamine-hydrolysing)